jgi:hypothetical protein
MFIGSSSENLDIAKAVQTNLQFTVDATIWCQGVFKASQSPLDSLEQQLEKSDFGLFVFTPDDILKLRQIEFQAVRDNVLFELGLYIGRLGKLRNFVLLPCNTSDFRFPSDLAGYVPISYIPPENGDVLTSKLGPACNEVEAAIKRVLHGETGDTFLNGHWNQVWSVESSKNFDKSNSSTANVQHVGNTFYTSIKAKDHCFEVNGKIERNMFITGTWSNSLKRASYFGSFQLFIDPSHNKLSGQWVGFNSQNEIRSGKWEWTRLQT